MCGCRGNQPQPARTENFEVRLPDGQVLTVGSEHEARVAVTRAGGGTFSRL
jgi:hypothetical protein